MTQRPIGLNGRPLGGPAVNVLPLLVESSREAWRLLLQSQISDPKKHFDPKVIAEEAFEYATKFVEEFKARYPQ